MSAQSLIGAQARQSQASQSLVTTPARDEAEPCVTGCQRDLNSEGAPPPAINGARPIQTNTAEALKKEAHSLRKQVESIKRERAATGGKTESPCGPGAPCRARLEEMEIAHRKELREMQEQHEGEVRQLEEQRDKTLQEESRAAARAMEALRAAHREELEREVEKARSLSTLVETSYTGHCPPANLLHGELDVLSESFSRKCLELRRAEGSSESRETELGRKERELEQLRRENRDLKAKLAEEVSRMRHFITGQRLDTAPLGSTASEVEVLLRAKENEVQYLKREISCLQNEVECLNKEKEAAYERYKEAYVEMSDVKGHSRLEMGALREHLKLANAALQEGARQT